MKEGYQTSGILQVGNELIQLFGCKHVIVFEKKDDLECCSEASGPGPVDSFTLHNHYCGKCTFFYF